MASFTELIPKIAGANAYVPKSLVAFDPGGTTGFSRFGDGKLTHRGQITAYNYLAVEQVIDLHQPQVVVVEEYVLYPWARKQQTWSDFPESRMIGAIELMCLKRKIRLVMQTPADAKNWCTDAKLKSWGYFHATMQHANDSVRHGTYWLLYRGKRNRPAPTVGKDWAHLKGGSQEPSPPKGGVGPKFRSPSYKPRKP